MSKGKLAAREIKLFENLTSACSPCYCVKLQHQI